MSARRILAVFLSACLAASLAGCAVYPGQREEPAIPSGEPVAIPVSPDEEEAIDQSTCFAPYEPGITASTARVIDAAQAYPEGDSWQDNLWTRAYEQQLGVSFTYAWTGEPYDYRDAILGMAASDTLPDYLSIPYDIFYPLAEGGHLAPLDDAFSQYACDEVRAAVEDYDGAARATGSVRGSLYGIASAPPMEGDLLWYRQDWLDAAGKERPATLEEMIDIMRAFADDPMQGGERTYGLLLSGALFSAQGGYPAGLDGFFSAYGAYPAQWIEESGELVHGSTKDSCLLALKQLKSLVAEGVIDPSFAQADPWSGALDAIRSGKVGLALGPRWLGEWIEGNRGEPRTDRQGLWACMPIPGLAGTANKVPTVARAGDITCVRAGYAHPDLAVKMVNLTRGLLEGKISQPQYTSVLSEEGRLIPTAQMAMAAGGGYGDERRAHYAASVIGALQNGGGEHLSGEALYLYQVCQAWQQGSDLSGYGIYVQFGPEGAQAALAQLRARSALMPDAYGGPQGGDWSQATLAAERDRAYIDIMLGGHAEDLFGAYLQAFDEQGGRELTRIANDWFATQ